MCPRPFELDTLYIELIAGACGLVVCVIGCCVARRCRRRRRERHERLVEQAQSHIEDGAAPGAKPSDECAGLAGEDVELRMIDSTGTAPLHALESDEPGALEGGPQ